MKNLSECKNFQEWWDSCTEEEREKIKELVIARLDEVPGNFKLIIG